MERDAGVVGRLLAHGVLDKRIPPLWETRPADFPLTREVLAHATGLVVHSRYVEARAREAGFRGPVWRIPHPAWPVGDVRPVEVEGDPLFGCFGHLNASKRIPQLLEAFARVHREHPARGCCSRAPSRRGSSSSGGSRRFRRRRAPPCSARTTCPRSG